MHNKSFPISTIAHAANPAAKRHQSGVADYLGPVIPEFEELFAMHPGDREPSLFNGKPPQPTIRPVIKMGHRNHYVGYFYSRKNGRLIPFESALEMDGLLLLEGSPEVSHYIVQPRRISVDFPGKRSFLVPDVLVIGDKRWYLEFKYDVTARTPSFGDRVERIRAFGDLKGIDYRVWTEIDVHCARLPQIRRLYENARWIIEPSVRRETARWLVNSKIGTYSEKKLALRRYPVAVAALDGFILDGLIDLHLERGLDSQMLSSLLSLRVLVGK